MHRRVRRPGLASGSVDERRVAGHGLRGRGGAGGQTTGGGRWRARAAATDARHGGGGSHRTTGPGGSSEAQGARPGAGKSGGDGDEDAMIR